MTNANKWGNMRRGLFLLVALVLATATSLGLMSKSLAVTIPGSTVFSSVGHYKVSVLTAMKENNLNISLDSGSTVVFAAIGYATESGTEDYTPLSQLSVSFNGGSATNLPAIDSVIPSDWTNRVMARQYVDATALVFSNGSGGYRMTNDISSMLIVQGVELLQFAIVIQESSDYPLVSVAVNDFFYSQGPNAATNLSASVNLSTIADPEQYIQLASSALMVLGGSFDTNEGDMAQASFVAGGTSGSLSNDNNTAVGDASNFWPWANWVLSRFSMDINASTLTLNVSNQTGGWGGEFAGWLIVVAPLVIPGGTMPELPIVYPNDLSTDMPQVDPIVDGNPSTVTPMIPLTPSTGFARKI